MKILIQCDSCSRYGAILRILNVGSFAEAVNKFNLTNSNRAWNVLEAIAARKIKMDRYKNTSPKNNLPSIYD